MTEIRLALECELIFLAKLDNTASLTPWSLASYQSSFVNPKHKIYVLEDAKQLVGAIIIGMVLDEAEILQFWIKKELQHQGYGKIFLEYIIDLCKKLQISDIFLEVRSDNICAFRLYSKFGFNHAGIRKDYYKIEGWVFDAITMHKKLAISNATTII